MHNLHTHLHVRTYLRAGCICVPHAHEQTHARVRVDMLFEGTKGVPRKGI